MHEAPVPVVGTFVLWGMGCVRGGGSLRRRRPGVWEVRVALGPDPVSGRTLVRSVTVHGDRETAQAAKQLDRLILSRPREPR